MKPRLLPALGAALLAACAPSRQVAPPPAPAPAPEAPAPAPVPASARFEAPRNWQLLDEATDSVPGISLLRAQRELLAGKAPRDTVLVAIIDGGIDTTHAGLRPRLWKNPREVPGNGKDDDGNLHADDVRGWDFIGGADGRDVHHDTYEVTRLYVQCQHAGVEGTAPGSNGAGPHPGTATPLTPAECARIGQDFARERSEAQQLVGQVQAMTQASEAADRILAQALGTDSFTVAQVRALQSADPRVQQARFIYLQLAQMGLTGRALAEASDEVESRVRYGLNPDYDPRPIVGDDYANTAQRDYGNADVMGPDPSHGTHVAGIIGAVPVDTFDVRGIAPAVRILMVRAVPDGDERDKDIANAIRYATDAGARVINMSFGKAYSPQKDAVDAAVKYADAHGVLMVHAAGNDGENLDTHPQYPSRAYLGGGQAQNWLEVGAASWKGLDSLAASFSNYSATKVDVFAPGVDILSTYPGGGYQRESGTSMATPVVTGLAALIMSYYPQLSAAEVKRAILESAARYPNQLVAQPGTGEEVRFGTLSATGGLVNAYGALKRAAELAAGK